MTFLPGTRRHRAQIIYFFRGQIGSWRSLGVGLVVGSRLHRIRHRCSSLVLSGSSGSHCPVKLEFGERTDTAIWHARLRAVDRREYTGPRPRSEKSAAIEQRQRAQTHFAPKPVLGGNLDARQQRQPSDPPRTHRSDPPAEPEREGQRRGDTRCLVHEAADQRQRAARAESHDIAEETSGDEAMMEERDDDKERGDGAGRDENKRRRHQRTLEEALRIGDDPTRGRREGGEVTQTAARGAVPYGLGLPQAAPPRGREERRRLAEVEKSRERCLELLTAKRPAKRDGRSRDGDAGQPTGGERAARKKRPEAWLMEALDADRRRFDEKAAEERETLRREREMLRRTSEKGGEGRHEYDRDRSDMVEPVIVEDVQDLIPLMSLRILKDERHALEEQGYVVRRVLANASIPPAGPPAGETGTREASGPTVEPPETNEGGHEVTAMEAVTKALKAARDAYGSTGELSRKTRSALVEMRHEAYKSAAEIVDATWRLLMKDGWRVEMRNPQSKKNEARYVNPQWTSYPNDERGYFPSKVEAVLYAFGVGAEALSDDVVGTVDEASRKMITDACEYWIEH